MKRSITEPMLIVLVLVLAFLLRMWGINYDLPFVFHPDEPVLISIIQNIFRTGDLNPHFFHYSSLVFYINTLAYVPYFLLGKLLGIFHTRSDIPPLISLAMGVTQAPMPTAVLLGRFVTITFGLGAVGLTYLSGKQLTGRAAVGIIAALMLAISPTAVRHSRYITPDTFVAFFALASFLASVLIYQQGKTWQYVTAGLLAGLTISSKYNGGLIVFPLVAAHFLRYGRTGLRQPKLYLALALCALGFLATTPYAILDSATFLEALRFDGQHYATGHAGMEGDSLKWYLSYMWETGGAIYLLALFGILYGFFTRPKETILLSIFPLIYFTFISSFIVRNDRTFLPMSPFLYLAAAWFLVILYDEIRRQQTGSWQKLLSALLVALTIVALAKPASEMISDTRYLTTVNSRETASVWTNDNLPAGSRIAIESYAPFIDPSRFSVQGFGRMIEHDPEWYVEQEFDYLIFGQGMYGRFYQTPGQYPDEASRYDSMFEQFNLVKTFNDGGYEVRVYQVQ